jgi:GNAT superfamily N-acetyltransferase
MSEVRDAVAISPATAADVPRILELSRELAAYERSLDQVTTTTDDLRLALFAAQPAGFAHVAAADGYVIGFALWFVNFSTWLGRHGIYVEDLYVTPDFYRRFLVIVATPERFGSCDGSWSAGSGTADGKA